MPYKILAVDDSNLNHKVLAKTLGANYQLTSVYSGKECLDYLADASQTKPHLVLLDVAMPEMDGYEVCTQIRRQSELQFTPVVFLSGRCSVEEKLKGYEVGGDEYVTKPFEAQELLIKIDRLLQNRVNEEALTNRIAQAEQLANHAQMDAGLMLVVMEFMTACLGVRRIDLFAAQMLKSIHSLGLQGSLIIRSKKGEHCFTEQEEVAQIEQKLLQQVLQSGSGIDAERRFAVSQESLAVLVKNMPLDESRPLLSSQLITLCSAAQARLQNLFDELEIKRQRDMLSLLVERSHRMVMEMDGNTQRLFDLLAAVIEEHVERLHRLSDDSNFNEFQESALNSECNDVLRQYTQAQNNANKLSDQFNGLLKELKLLDMVRSG